MCVINYTIFWAFQNNYSFCFKLTIPNKTQGNVTYYNCLTLNDFFEAVWNKTAEKSEVHASKGKIVYFEPKDAIKSGCMPVA